MTGFLLTTKQKLMLCINKRLYRADWTHRRYGRSRSQHNRSNRRYRCYRSHWRYRPNWADWTYWANRRYRANRPNRSRAGNIDRF